MKDNFLLVPLCSRKEGEKKRKNQEKERKKRERRKEKWNNYKGGEKSTLNKQCVSPRWRRDFYSKKEKRFLNIF